ncbi:MAG TPA: helix-turn-helix domain-containing protein [Propioniciclava tarda]|nr:helix-turn-helix domain-containing protein [Propioniciclava tarda]HQA31120.1 helix-turn-helix domain-containing protein [Propioniciclava tarda]HQD60245.1 helix-turn-helix domain-containing protein [Propioniciclava tarda]
MAGQGTGSVSAARQRVLSALAEAGRPLTLAELSERTGSHPNTLREHLTSLVASGSAESTALPDPGRRGRPPLAYRAVAPPSDAGASLLNALLAEVSERPDADALALAAGRRWGAGFAPGSRPELLIHLSEAGYAPEEVADGIVLRACPVSAFASQVPGLVCRMHLGAIVRLLPAETEVELIPGGHPQGCLVRIDPQLRAG